MTQRAGCKHFSCRLFVGTPRAAASTIQRKTTNAPRLEKDTTLLVVLDERPIVQQKRSLIATWSSRHRSSPTGQPSRIWQMRERVRSQKYL
ncbi:Hypothetical predicted protein [Cloeon dipterum]|uniref:Uncharacterized protein n=1 Tax=Cloeon dipterum TaxID=197152 RepID=A0A8S1DMC7_9INSE|nr:Hypothetical predicted protein [Cloeon dipterum]